MPPRRQPSGSGLSGRPRCVRPASFPPRSRSLLRPPSPRGTQSQTLHRLLVLSLSRGLLVFVKQIGRALNGLWWGSIAQRGSGRGEWGARGCDGGPPDTAPPSSPGPRSPFRRLRHPPGSSPEGAGTKYRVPGRCNSSNLRRHGRHRRRPGRQGLFVTPAAEHLLLVAAASWTAHSFSLCCTLTASRSVRRSLPPSRHSSQPWSRRLLLASFVSKADS